MASNTPRLNLYKKDPVADANDTFNIQTMLNDNWDRIDADVVLVSEKGQPNGVATLGPDGKVPTEQLSSDVATKDELTHLNLNVIDMAVELETLKGATLNGVTANIFIETFQNLDDINLMNGTYDSTNKRLVL